MSRCPLPRVALLDLDGTLVDTAPDLAFCVDRVMESFQRPPVGVGRVRTWIGNGVEALLERALTDRLEGEADSATLRIACQRFEALYAEHVSVLSRTYPGVTQGLDYLRSNGVALGCVTNKPERHTRSLLARQQLLDVFSVVVGGDSLPQRKPHPLPLQHALAVLEVTPDRAVFIGDSVNDVRAARAAAVTVICVSYGYNHGRGIHEAGPDHIIDSLADLARLFDLEGSEPPASDLAVHRDRKNR